MKRITKRIASVLVILGVLACLVGGCGAASGYEEIKTLTYEEALEELSSKLTKVPTSAADAPLDIYENDTATTSLADISTFPLKTKGKGEINIEIAAATELSAEAPDDLINVWAKKFNDSKPKVNGKTASVTVRQITSGETVTYMTEGDYRPEVFVPSSYAWGEMLEAKGMEAVKLTDRLVGNTAGILMEEKTHEKFVKKYHDVSMDKVIEASLAGDLLFAYSNPYTSSTGLNAVAETLRCFDPVNPLSDTAEQKLLQYQRQSPPVAYTTAVLCDQAAKGIIKAMVMEEQAYRKTPELNDFVYTPFGIRHDHPVYTFDYVSAEKQEVAKQFAEYCLTAEAQKIADDKGFNLHDDYQEQSAGLDGAGYLAAQKIWKTNKDGGRPIIAVFVADVSGSMDGEPLNALKTSLLSTMKYISSDNYIGLVSYSDDVVVNLGTKHKGKKSTYYTIEQFDETQRAYFSGAVKSLAANGGTATYSAVLVALDMLRATAEEVPDAKLMLFVLSDGAQNRGYSLGKIIDIVAGMKVPVYTIGYNLYSSDELETLSGINEATLINAEPKDIVNQLRNLFNVQL